MSEFLEPFTIILAIGFGVGAMASMVVAGEKRTRSAGWHARNALIFLVLAATFAGIAGVVS